MVPKLIAPHVQWHRLWMSLLMTPAQLLGGIGRHAPVREQARAVAKRAAMFAQGEWRWLHYMSQHRSKALPPRSGGDEGVIRQAARLLRNGAISRGAQTLNAAEDGVFIMPTPQSPIP